MKASSTGSVKVCAGNLDSITGVGETVADGEGEAFELEAGLFPAGSATQPNTARQAVNEIIWAKNLFMSRCSCANFGPREVKNPAMVVPRPNPVR
jgi:hypothetical protein